MTENKQTMGKKPLLWYYDVLYTPLKNQEEVSEPRHDKEDQKCDFLC